MAGETENPGTDSFGNSGSGTQNTNTNDNQAPPNPAPASSETPKTYTEAELQAVLQGRLSKYKDFDSIKDRAKKFDDLEAANKTETERLQSELDRTKNENQDRTSRYETMVRKSAVISEATKAGATDPDTVFELLKARDFPGLDIADDESVPGVSKAVADILKEKPFLKGPKFQGSANGGPQSDPADDIDTMSVEDYMRKNTPQDSALKRFLGT